VINNKQSEIRHKDARRRGIFMVFSRSRYFRSTHQVRAQLYVLLSLLGCIWSTHTVAAAQEPAKQEAKMGECDHYTPHKRPFFGDLHLHTGLSLDAVQYYTESTPETAYRFAKGEPMPQPVAEGEEPRYAQLERPLDFAAVTDHAEWLAVTNVCFDEDDKALAFYSPYCVAMRTGRKVGSTIGSLTKLFSLAANAIPYVPFEFNVCTLRPWLCNARERSVWEEITTAADNAHDFSSDCSFTALKGYEWTGTPLYNNLHRNVIFKTSEVPKRPIDYYDASTPEKLWSKLDRRCKSKADCDVLAIPHNANLAGGLMYKTETLWGRQYNAKMAKTRQQFEPISEIVQAKGASECFYDQSNPFGSNDEECAFEQVVQNKICTGDEADGEACTFLCSDMIIPMGGFLGACVEPADFTRGALRRGLLAQSDIGENPFKFGFIGSTDTHNGTAGDVEEYNFEGVHGSSDATVAQRVTTPTETTGLDFTDNTRFYNPGGLAVIWAEQNTREALFDAMVKRETYATSGTRIILRMFAGWNLDEGMCQSEDFVAQGYNQGVPMGGDLYPTSDQSAAPKFAVSALMDAGIEGYPGTSLQKIQMVKLWESNGESFEQVYDIAGGKTDASVDLNTCLPTGSGYSSLCTVWSDPHFNKDQNASYYVRVLENDSCRYSKRQCNTELSKRGLTCSNIDASHELYGCCDGKTPDTIQERAWSSPVWYNAQR
jgi:hypothetical protein